MKIIRVEKKESKISREIISRFGNSVYHNPEVKAVFIKVNFKNGSSIGFRKDEEEDGFEEIFEKG